MTKREKILAAFNVSEEEIAALEESSGWKAAQEEAERARKRFNAEIRQRATENCRLLSQELGYVVQFDWSDD